MIYYTGIGSEEITKEMYLLMYKIGMKLATYGFTLLSGGANGSDDAFEKGCIINNGSKIIILPYHNFRGKPKGNDYILFKDLKPEVQLKCFDICAELHPAWARIGNSNSSVYLKRDVNQVLGINLDIQSKFIICWTPCGSIDSSTLTRESGGTAMAIRVATKYGIPVFNLQRLNELDRFADFIKANNYFQ